MKQAFDWLARTAIIALSLVATLSIIGSIAAIPSGRIEGRLGIEQPRENLEPATTPESRPRGSEASSVDEEADSMQSADAAAMAPSTPRDQLEPWLESISYALIAIAAMLAATVFLLWRALGHLRRLADAAERRI